MAGARLSDTAQRARFAALAALIVMLGLTAWLAALPLSAQPHRIDPQDIAVRPALPVEDDVLVLPRPDDVAMSTVPRAMKSDRLRLHHPFPGAVPERPYAVWARDMELTAINFSRAELTPVSPGVPIYRVPKYAYLSDVNAINIVQPARSGRADLGRLYFGPQEELERAARMDARLDRLLPRLGTAAGALVIAAALAGLFFGAFTPRLGLLALGGAGTVAAHHTGLTELWGAWRALVWIALAAVLAGLAQERRARSRMLDAPFALLGFGALASVCLALGTLGLLGLPPHWARALALAPIPALLWLSGRELAARWRARRSRLGDLTAIVERQNRALTQQLRDRAVMEERERFTRDIHDGVGGQLLSLLLRLRTGAVSEPKAIASELQAGLHDLRLVVDAMDHTGDDLGYALSTFRARAEAQLRAAGIALDWVQPKERVSHRIDTGGTLHLFRFMQEAVTNIVRHSGASRVRIEISDPDTQPGFGLFISDNGTGLDASVREGRGLANLRRRAELLGAMLTVEPGLDGRGLGYALRLPVREGAKS